MSTRVRGADVSLRDVTIETRDGKRGLGVRMTSCTGSVRGGFGGFEKSERVENLTPNEKGRLSGLAESRRICALRAPLERGGADGKDIMKRLCISLPCVETFNSKVIKSFIPEL